MTVMKLYPCVLTQKDPTIVPVTNQTTFGMEAFALVKCKR